jgi:adenylate cyclase
MRTPPRILLVDDSEFNLDMLHKRLEVHGYELFTAADGEAGLAAVYEHLPDLILLDVMMPKLDGFEVCRRVRADPELPYIPIILVTARTDTRDIVAGLEAGGDEYLTKPVDGAALVARVKSMLRLKGLQDTVQAQATRLAAQSAELARWNASLQEQVERQLEELQRLSQLRRFLPPQLAEALLSSGAEAVLEQHRRQITVVFCDLRGFTAFAVENDAEDVMEVLREYHAALGELIFEFEGTLERFTGDGLMVFFNDPLMVPDAEARAVRMAVAMRERVEQLVLRWRRLQYNLGFGVGVSRGYATLGRIGFEGRYDYAAIGTVTNLAARLCDEAQAGQVLIERRVYTAVESLVEAEYVGDLELKGLSRPVATYNVLGLREAGDGR